MRKSRLMLTLAIGVAMVLVLVPGASADPASTPMELVHLDAAPGWNERSDASGSVLVFIDETDVASFDVKVRGLRCRGPAFNRGQQEAEALRYYELVINGQALMRFNTSCNYGFRDEGIGGVNFSTLLIISKDALDFSVGSDELAIEVYLRPDDALALTGSTAGS